MSRDTDQHDLVAKLTELHAELGRRPLRDEFASRYGKHYESVFGSFAVMLQAAGLGDSPKREKRPDPFLRDLESHIAEYEPRPPVDQGPIPTMAWISDIHWPFQNDQVVTRFLEYVGDAKPAVVGINGDAWDMFSHGRFPRSHNVFTPRQEREMARERNEAFWRGIKACAPDARRYQNLGNHDARPYKKVLAEYPEAEDWIAEGLKRDFSFEGVETVFDPRQELIFGSVMVHHGYRTRLGEHRDFALMNSINGHSHVGGVVFRRIRGQTLWELNCGLAGDPEKKGLTHTPQKITNWTPGFGIVNSLGPQFISV